MKQIFIAAVLSLVAAGASAGISLSSELVGIWATDDSVFKGEAIVNGSALYLNANGAGAMVGGNGADVLGIRIVVSTYDLTTHVLSIDLTENGKVAGSASLIYDPVQQVITSPKDQNRAYHRRMSTLSAGMRKTLGLD